MVKIVKKDYPFTAIIEDKISHRTVELYQSALDTYVKKQRTATTAENAYQRLKFEREKERETRNAGNSENGGK